MRLIEGRARVFKLRSENTQRRIEARLADATSVRQRLLERIIRLQVEPLREAFAEFRLQRVITILRIIEQQVGDADVGVGQELHRAGQIVLDVNDRQVGRRAGQNLAANGRVAEKTA